MLIIMGTLKAETTGFYTHVKCSISP